MPSKYLVEADGAVLAAQLGARCQDPPVGAWPAHVFPKLKAPVLVWADGGRWLRPMQLGFLLSSDNGKKPTTLHNARWETIDEKVTFRGPFQHTRCLVPMIGFFEYSDFETTPRWYGWLAPKDGRLGVAAGLWMSWQSPQEGALDLFVIITRDAPDNAQQVGVTRAPVWLPQENWDAWLDPNQHNPRTLKQVLQRFDPIELVVEQQAPPTRTKAAAVVAPSKKAESSPQLSLVLDSD